MAKIQYGVKPDIFKYAERKEQRDQSVDGHREETTRPNNDEPSYTFSGTSVVHLSQNREGCLVGNPWQRMTMAARWSWERFKRIGR